MFACLLPLPPFVFALLLAVAAIVPLSAAAAQVKLRGRGEPLRRRRLRDAAARLSSSCQLQGQTLPVAFLAARHDARLVPQPESCLRFVGTARRKLLPAYGLVDRSTRLELQELSNVTP